MLVSGEQSRLFATGPLLLRQPHAVRAPQRDVQHLMMALVLLKQLLQFTVRIGHGFAASSDRESGKKYGAGKDAERKRLCEGVQEQARDTERARKTGMHARVCFASRTTTKPHQRKICRVDWDDNNTWEDDRR